METHVTPIRRDPERTAYDLLFVAKALLSIVLFLFVVIVWDSLPSTPPLMTVTTKVDHVFRFSHHTINYTESYRVIKSVDFEIVRRMTHIDSGQVHKLPSTNNQYLLGPHTETISIPAPTLKGRWCINAQVIWVNGLSIADHRHNLPNTCFEVNNDY